MKTFKQFLYEASIAQRIKMRAVELIKKYHKVDPEKVEVYKNLIKRTNERTKPIFPDDEHGRDYSRRDKHLEPSYRLSSEERLKNPPTVTKNPKKLRKQRALGEIPEQFKLNVNPISEKYYEPDEKTPSGKTPIQKAESRGITGEKLRKVKRGSDNREIDVTPQKGIVISKQHNTTKFSHPETGIEFDITHRKKPIDDRPHHSIHWWNTAGEARTPEERRRLAHTVKRIWHQHVQPTLPHGSVVSNQPASDTHKKLYARAKFGNPHPDVTSDQWATDDRYGRQYAIVGREPSPRQKVKGKKTRLSPMNPPKERQPVDG